MLIKILECIFLLFVCGFFLSQLQALTYPMSIDSKETQKITESQHNYNIQDKIITQNLSFFDSGNKEPNILLKNLTKQSLAQHTNGISSQMSLLYQDKNVKQELEQKSDLLSLVIAHTISELSLQALHTRQGQLNALKPLQTI